MNICFSKYQGTGNDFILINNGLGDYDCLKESDVVKLCDRRFGIGADGLILLNKVSEFDFEAVYYNSDGSKSFCGNGARCAVMFAFRLNWIGQETKFLGTDGPHEATIHDGEVALRMADVNNLEVHDSYTILNTGSPHYISFVDTIDTSDIVSFGKSIRFSERFFKEGINVNLVEKTGDSSIRMLTYERGVEDETLSCGTGATAAAISFVNNSQNEGDKEILVAVKGGELRVKLHVQYGQATNIWLIGPAMHVFDGEIEL